MQRDYYSTPEPSYIMRRLWNCSGADEQLLRRSTNSDQVKYACLGGIILSTGVMAGLAGGYAFYTIFQPKGSALDDVLHLPTAGLSVIFGMIWGLMIFNIDRFIIAATGKGDGTEAITIQEFKSAIPRIVMGAIIALTISKPVEIRMFKTEIDVALYKKQQEVERSQISNIDSIYGDRIKKKEEELKRFQKEIDDKDAQVTALQNEYVKETQGGRGNAYGVGEVARAIQVQLETAKLNLAAAHQSNDTIIAELRTQLADFQQQKNGEIGTSKKAAYQLDGLLERIKLSHEIAGFWISLFITLLFMAIELTPIFFKMMLIKGPYDYLEENLKELIRADEGIEVQYDYYQDKKGQERDLEIFHKADLLMLEKRAVTKAQEELSRYALEKWMEKQKAEIDKDPGKYIYTGHENGESNGAVIV